MAAECYVIMAGRKEGKSRLALCGYKASRSLFRPILLFGGDSLLANATTPSLLL